MRRRRRRLTVGRPFLSAFQVSLIAVGAAAVVIGATSQGPPPAVQLGRLSQAPALPATTFAGTPPPPPVEAGAASPGAAASPASTEDSAAPPARAPAPARPAAPPPAPASSPTTFNLVGGSATVSCGGGSPSLVAATPRPGYDVEHGFEDGGATLEVRFRSDTHDSRLDAWCTGGTVQARVEESSS